MGCEICGVDSVPVDDDFLCENCAEVIHEVTWWESVRSFLLRRVPRAVCGVVLDGDPDATADLFDKGAPPCPRCARL
ncbi:hypothetical protein [Nocardia sp. NPDC051750]|uniref:hypothetical protein n=1 Tax=Nocardia sp. NPDC051750 TaxID=3364325 RepID=UPI0037BA31C5